MIFFVRAQEFPQFQEIFVWKTHRCSQYRESFSWGFVYRFIRFPDQHFSTSLFVWQWIGACFRSFYQSFDPDDFFCSEPETPSVPGCLHLRDPSFPIRGNSFRGICIQIRMIFRSTFIASFFDGWIRKSGMMSRIRNPARCLRITLVDIMFQKI